MKKRRKLQNQQIILNQDISIKLYSNFLTFVVLNSFRLKYYYMYLKYVSLFKGYSWLLMNSFTWNFFLVKILSNNVLNLNFLNFYGSNLLHKFTESKNLYNDYLNYVQIASLSKYKSKLSNYSFLNNYQISVNINKDTLNNDLGTYSIDYRKIGNNLRIEDYNTYYFTLRNFLFYLFIVQYINIYKFLILLNFVKKI